MKTSKQSENLKIDRALMVGVEIFQDQRILSLDDSLSELRRLADTAGFEVVGQVTQKLDHPNPKTFIGPGRVDERKGSGH
jgi:GTP-binding protein HflX